MMQQGCNMMLDDDNRVAGLKQLFICRAVPKGTQKFKKGGGACHLEILKEEKYINIWTQYKS
jgi:hypothetical protein